MAARPSRAQAPDPGRPSDALRPQNRAPNELVARVQAKLHALLWVGVAAALLTRGGVLEAGADPARSLPFFIYLALTALGVVITIMLYCVCWVRRVHGSQWPLDIVAPGMVPAATVAGVACLLCLVVGLWPAYGLLTPLVVGALGLGGLFSFHFVPQC